MSGPGIDVDAFRDFERSAHDEIADGYRRFFTAVTGYAVEPLLDAASVRAGARLLDVATGPGVVAFRAVGRGATAVGVDLAPHMLALAAAHHPGVDFRLGDAEDLALAAHSFDGVVCNFGIGHFPRPERALGEFVRVLAPGGVAAVSWWDFPERNRVNGIFFDAMNAARVRRCFASRIPGSWPPRCAPPGSGRCRCANSLSPIQWRTRTSCGAVLWVARSGHQ
jgi:SAM-dependent methyltransferase